MEDKRARMKFLVDRLNAASKAYYQDAEEIMPNIEYDAMYDELLALEKETGIILSGSPSQNVGYEILSDLPKERHPSRMLSLDKTKSRDELTAWLGAQKGVLSWKLDGITIVLTYDNGTLTKALTRGNGDIGEVITGNAKVFDNVPLSIAYKGHLVLRGEAIIKYSDFEEINSRIGDADAKYKNPRNLTSGSVRQLDPRVTKDRHVNFMAFTLVEADGVNFENSRMRQMEWLAAQGFDVVESVYVTADDLVEHVNKFAEAIVTNDFPSDGLVLTYDDIEYGRSLGTTAKYPRDAIAFKWADEKAETTLREIEWSASRTGLINPVAIFDPVELEGTTVSRASVHNISIMEELGLGIGDTITVYKANMIIPQIAEDLTPSRSIEIPAVCPVCGGPTRIKEENGVRTLYCTEKSCPAKQIKGFAHFVSRDAMNIDGLSEATLEKFISRGLIHEFADIFDLGKVKDEIVGMEGFGEKSFVNLVNSAKAAAESTPDRLLYALGVPGIGVANARVIARYCGNDWNRIVSLTKEEVMEIEGVGDVLASAYTDFFANEKNKAIIGDILKYVKLDETAEERQDFMAGLTFVITGSLNGYANRDELVQAIEKCGGKTAGSVSNKTSYLINNDLTSTSGKNKKAKELGVPIIDEETITRWIREERIDETEK